MPRIVDHDERRSEIIAALVAFAAREGLHNVSMRAIAAEAGVSLRLVQYYFENKAGLMQAGLRFLEDRSNARWSQRLSSSTNQPSAKAVLVSLFEEALPIDREARDFHLLWTSYAMLAMTDPDIPDRTFVEGPNRLQQRLCEILARGKVAGDLDKDIDVEHEAAVLLGLIHGLGTAVLVGQQTGDAALQHLKFHLEKLCA
jgi:AcrR family transcriptional regulator